jgi:3-oxoacyl-[acyl-carrier protein] reductase
VIDLGGRRVLVTGGSRGIGAACCRLFARAGAAVLVHYQSREDRATALLEELRGLDGTGGTGGMGAPLDPIDASGGRRPAGGAQPEGREGCADRAGAGPGAGEGAAPGAGEAVPHLARRCDLRDPADVWAMFAFVAAEWGVLDVLVNNAGIWVPNPLGDFDAAVLDETLAVNVTGSFLCAAAALPLLEQAADGNIVNVTSTAGQRGEPRYSPYAASKGAMIAATRSWAVELAPRVRVNSVAPGWVDTDMTAEALSGPGRNEVLAGIPLGRIATPDDIAGPVVFLASSLARHVTGEVLSVNGGSVLGG